MSTISDFISRNRKAQAESRLAQLEKMGNAPQVILDGIRKEIENPLKGVGKVQEFGHLEFTSFEVKTGKGGKQYVRFHIEGQPDACFIPNGQYGPFVYQEK